MHHKNRKLTLLLIRNPLVKRIIKFYALIIATKKRDLKTLLHVDLIVSTLLDFSVSISTGRRPTRVIFL